MGKNYTPYHREPYDPDSWEPGFSVIAAGRRVVQDMLFTGLRQGSLAYELMSAAAGRASDANTAALKRALENPACLPDFAGSYSGITPLMAAALRGNLPAVEMLASHPLVSLGRTDNAGATALHYAAALGHDDCVRSLLKHHAPAFAVTKDGRKPLDLAQGETTQNAFWTSDGFRQQMRRQNPGHRKLKEPQPSFAAAAQQAPETNPPREALSDLVSRFAGHDGTQLKQDFGSMRALEPTFDWEGVFIAAAGRGNVEAMRFLHDQFLFDEDTLDRALAAAICHGDQRDAAHHLLIWGANPAARYEPEKKSPTIFEAAFNRDRAGAFEEMVLWHGEKLRKAEAKRFRNAALSPRMKQALDLHAWKRSLRRLGGREQSNALFFAVLSGKIAPVMAGYAEATRDRFMRRPAKIGKETGGGAIAVALLHERYEFARLLISDGFRLQDAPAYSKLMLDMKGTPKARQFAKDILEGKLKVPAVRDVGAKKRSELRAMIVFAPRGPYGAF